MTTPLTARPIHTDTSVTAPEASLTRPNADATLDKCQSSITPESSSSSFTSFIESIQSAFKNFFRYIYNTLFCKNSHDTNKDTNQGSTIKQTHVAQAVNTPSEPVIQQQPTVQPERKEPGAQAKPVPSDEASEPTVQVERSEPDAQAKPVPSDEASEPTVQVERSDPDAQAKPVPSDEASEPVIQQEPTVQVERSESDAPAKPVPSDEASRAERHKQTLSEFSANYQRGVPRTKRADWDAEIWPGERTIGSPSKHSQKSSSSSAQINQTRMAQLVEERADLNKHEFQSELELSWKPTSNAKANASEKTNTRGMVFLKKPSPKPNRYFKDNS